MLNRDQLEAFATVAEIGSFDQAARVLNITRGAVSQPIKALEQTMTNILLVRTQPVVTTPAGGALLRHVKALRLMELSMLRELRGEEAQDRPASVAIAVNPDSLTTWFPGALWPLLLDRRMMIELVTADEDLTVERLSRGEVLGCICTKPNAGAGFVADPLGKMEYRCYASPAFCNLYFPNGLSVSEVMMAPAVLFDRNDSLHDRYLELCFGFPIVNYPKHLIPSPTTLLEALVAGAGYGLMPSEQAVDLVQCGNLIELPGRYAVDVPLYWHRWVVEPALWKNITNHIIAVAAERLKPIDTSPVLSAEAA